MKSEQEIFWEGDFGNEYVQRSRGDHIIASNTALFARILAKAPDTWSVIEFGANIGLNLRAIANLLPAAKLSAIEINASAAKELMAWGGAKVAHCSILEFEPPQTWDMALVKGVLIHINPDQLAEVYDRLYKAASRYICLVEYYNPTPIEVTYRGHAGRLFKRDFAGELLDRFVDLELVDYGFLYRRDQVFSQDDDMNWFLLRKR